MNSGWLNKRNSLVFPLACFLAAAMVLISEGSYWQATTTLRELAQVQAERMTAWQLTEGMLNAETGQRGYLLTGQKEFLQPYETGLKQVSDAFPKLDRDHDDEPETMLLLGRMHRLSEAKLSELAHTISAFDRGENEAAIKLVSAGRGNKLMDEIRAEIVELQGTSTQATANNRVNIYRTLNFSRIGMSALSLFSLIGIFLYLRQSREIMAHQENLKNAIQHERDGLEIEVSHRTLQLTELTQHLQTAREDERNRLARNLHDELGALLTSAKLDAARIRSRLTGIAPEALERLAHLVETLNSSIAMGRRIIEDLRPSTLSNLGLIATLEILTQEFSDQSGIEVYCTLEEVKLSASAELMVYRLVQEAITNITKYAQAKQVWVSMTATAGQVEMLVRDDGVGFDSQAIRGGAYGLLGMRFRVEAEGGNLNLQSSPGRGTSLMAVIPESAAA